MAVISVRFNSKEEKILKTLKDYYNCDSSNLIKRTLLDLYEEIKDREIIEQFEIHIAYLDQLNVQQIEKKFI